MTVVVCRARHQADELEVEIEARGGRALLFPLLEPAPPADGGKALARALDQLDAHDWLVVTSANAVDAVAKVLASAPGSRVAVVGPATEAAARAAGWSVDFVASTATAEVLAAELPLATSSPGSSLSGRPPRVLAPLAEEAADTLVEGLTARGAMVRRVEAYRMTTPVHRPELVAEVAAADAVLLTSPSIARRFAAIVGVTIPVVVAIGPSTAQAAEAVGFTLSATADPHTTAGLMAALDTTIRS